MYYSVFGKYVTVGSLVAWGAKHTLLLWLSMTLPPASRTWGRLRWWCPRPRGRSTGSLGSPPPAHRVAMKNSPKNNEKVDIHIGSKDKVFAYVCILKMWYGMLIIWVIVIQPTQIFSYSTLTDKNDKKNKVFISFGSGNSSLSTPIRTCSVESRSRSVTVRGSLIIEVNILITNLYCLIINI